MATEINSPASIQHLNDEIREAIEEISLKGYGPVSVVVVIICLILFSTMNGIVFSL